MKKLIAVLILMFSGAGLWLHHEDYFPVVEPAVRALVAGGNYASRDPGSETRLLFCGTGSPSRNPARSGPCLALIAGGKLYLFDAGEGAIGRLHEFEAPVLRLEKIFLTHLHSDHISGVAEVLHNTWLYGRQHPVALVGPPGTEEVLNGIRAVYHEDLTERMHVLAQDGVDPAIAFSEAVEVTVDDQDAVVVVDKPGLKIEAFRVNHPAWHYAYGYKIQVANKIVVVSGDTTYSENLLKHARGADLLIHEALNTRMMKVAGATLAESGSGISESRIEDIAKVHTSTSALAELAAETDISHLLLTHLIPPIPDIYPARAAFISTMDQKFRGELTVAYDGLWVDL